MPVRRSLVHSLEVIAYTGETVRLALHVSSGTYVRSIAQAIGGHCTSLRRTAVGPFDVEESQTVDEAVLLPVAAALARLPAGALDQVPEAIRAGVLALDGRTTGSAA